MFVRHRYSTQPRSLPRGVAYLAGGRDEERPLFGPAGALDRAGAGALLAPGAGEPFLLHRLIVSPDPDECPDDLAAMTRQAVGALGLARGRPAAWVAAEHHHQAQPHVHVLIAGHRGLRLGPPDYHLLKEAARDYCRLELDLKVALEEAQRPVARHRPLPAWDEEDLRAG